MHDNVCDILEKIVDSPRLLSKFLELDTIDEIYYYCRKLKCDCSKEDFTNDICEMLSFFFGDEMDANELSDLEMSYVAGGARAKIFNRTVASALSMLMAGTSMNMASAQSAVAVDATPKPSFKQRLSGWWQKYKKPILVVLGIAATAIVATLTIRYISQKGQKLRDDSKSKLKELSEANTVLEKATENYTKALDDWRNGVLKKDNSATSDKNQDQNSQSSGGQTADAALNAAKDILSTAKEHHNAAVQALGGLEEGETVQDIYKRFNYNAENGEMNEQNFFQNAWTFVKHLKGKKSNERWKNLGHLGTVIGGIGGAWNLIDSGFEKLSKFGKRISHISNMKYHMKNMGDSISDSYQKWLRQLEPKKDLNLKDVPEKLNALFEEIKGQDKAKFQIRAAIENILRTRDYMERIGEEYNHGDVLYFIGPSGVGKTMMAEGLARYNILTTHEDVYFVSASDVDPDSRQSVIDQLFGGSPYSYGGGYGAQNGNPSPIINKQRSLVKFLTDHPGGIVIVDEYDKIWTKSLDEIFRTIVDRGELRIGSQTINCKGTTFILTSNESSASIRGGNQESSAPVEHDDGTGSRTVVKHDKSFLNRIKPIEFENLSQEDYANIARDEYQFYLTDYWAIEDVCGLNLVIDDECLKNVAIVTERVNEGARYIKKLRGDLFLEISLTVYAMESVFGKDCMRGQKLFVAFDTETESFTLKNEHGQVLNDVEELQKIIASQQDSNEEDDKKDGNKSDGDGDAKVADKSSASDKPNPDSEEPIKEKAGESEKIKTSVEAPKPEEKPKKEEAPAEQFKTSVEASKPEEKPKKEEAPAEQSKTSVEAPKPEEKPKKEEAPAEQSKTSVEASKPEEKPKKEPSKPVSTPTVKPLPKPAAPKQQSTTDPTPAKSKPAATTKTSPTKQNTKKTNAQTRKHASPLTH